MARRNDKTELPGHRGFKGEDNTAGEASLPGGAVREAENVDFRTDGRVKRRQGSTLVHAGMAVHSLFAWNDGHVWAQGANLYFRKGAPMTGLPTPLVTGLRTRERISYSEIDSDAGVDLFWSNGLVSGIIEPDESTKAWGLETPGGLPSLSANPVGSYVAGRYQVTLTYLDALGRESGAPGPALLTLADGQGIDLTDIPQPADANVTAISVYVSDRDGEVLYHHTNFDVGTATATLYRIRKGQQCPTLFMDPLPAGHIVRYANGRLLSVADNYIYFSQPLRYGICKIHHDYIQNALRVTLLEPVSDGEGSGFFYADNKRTYYVEGSNPEAAQIKVVYPHGAIARSSTLAPGPDLGFEYSGHVPIWLAKNGRPVAGLPGGQVQVLNDRFVADDFDHGASIYRESDTIKQIIIAVTGKGLASDLRAKDTAVASVHFAPNLIAENAQMTDLTGVFVRFPVPVVQGLTAQDIVVNSVHFAPNLLGEGLQATDIAVSTVTIFPVGLIGLTAYYEVQEGAGLTRVDNANPGPLDLSDNNTVGQAAGPGVGQFAADMTSASNHSLTLPFASGASNFVMGTGDWSCSFWCRPDELAGTERVLSVGFNGDPQGGMHIEVQAGNGRITVTVDDNTGNTHFGLTDGIIDMRGVYFHAMVKFNRATDRIIVKIDNVTQSWFAGDDDISGINDVQMNSIRDLSLGGNGFGGAQFDGRQCFVGFWSVFTPDSLDTFLSESGRTFAELAGFS